MRKSKCRWAIGLSLMVVVPLFGCTTSGKKLLPTTGRAEIGGGNVQEITMRVESYFFEPSRVEVTIGVPVRLTLKSGAVIIPHNFSIHAPEAGIDIDADVGHGKTVVVEFTPTKTGEYQFYCDKGSHAEKGMMGTIVVVEK